MSQTKRRIFLLGLMLLVGILLGVIIAFGFLSIAYSQTYSERDSIGFALPLMLDNTLADWDSARVILYCGRTAIDTTDLTSSTPGIYLAKHAPLDPGSYCAFYLAFYGSDTAADAWHFAVLDTSELQGSAAGLSASDVESACSTAAADNPDLFIDGACAGSGSEVVNVYVKNQADSTGIGGVEVEIWDIDLNNLTAGALETQNSGLITFSLNVDTFGVVIRKDRWIFTTPETLYVTTDMDTTYYGQAYSSVSLPEGMCYVYGKIYHLNGDPCESCLAVISIDEDYQPVRHSGKQVMHQPDTAYTNSAGLWKMFLYQSSALTPDTTAYVFSTINPWSKGIYTEKDVEVPDSTEWFYGQ